MQKMSDCSVSVGWYFGCCVVHGGESCTDVCSITFFNKGIERILHCTVVICVPSALLSDLDCAWINGGDDADIAFLAQHRCVFNDRAFGSLCARRVHVWHNVRATCSSANVCQKLHKMMLHRELFWFVTTTILRMTLRTSWATLERSSALFSLASTLHDSEIELISEYHHARRTPVRCGGHPHPDCASVGTSAPKHFERPRFIFMLKKCALRILFLWRRLNTMSSRSQGKARKAV